MSGSAPILAGRVAVVTGAAGGMGTAIAASLSESGAATVLADIDAGAGESLAAELRGRGHDSAFVLTDVSVEEDVRRLVETAVEGFGGLDCAVNAAAIEREVTPIAAASVEDFDQITAVNLRSIFLCLKYEISTMVAAGTEGSIVNVGSINSFRPQVGQPAYTAAKHGVLGLTRSAALDYARHGIRVNMIAPGAIDTPMLREGLARWGTDPEKAKRRLGLLGRFGTPEEVGRAAVWLCSDASSFTTGDTVAVDGGWLAR